MQILKIWNSWLKNWARPAHLNFEFKIAIARSILKLETCSRCQNLAKIISSFSFFYNNFALMWMVPSQFTKTRYFIKDLGYSPQEFHKILWTVA